MLRKFDDEKPNAMNNLPTLSLKMFDNVFAALLQCTFLESSTFVKSTNKWQRHSLSGKALVDCKLKVSLCGCRQNTRTNVERNSAAEEVACQTPILDMFWNAN